MVIDGAMGTVSHSYVKCPIVKGLIVTMSHCPSSHVPLTISPNDTFSLLCQNWSWSITTWIINLSNVIYRTPNFGTRETISDSWTMGNPPRRSEVLLKTLSSRTTTSCRWYVSLRAPLWERWLLMIYFLEMECFGLWSWVVLFMLFQTSGAPDEDPQLRRCLKQF